MASLAPGLRRCWLPPQLGDSPLSLSRLKGLDPCKGFYEKALRKLRSNVTRPLEDARLRGKAVLAAKGLVLTLVSVL